MSDDKRWTYERIYVRTYIRTGQTLYPLYNFVGRGDKKQIKHGAGKEETLLLGLFLSPVNVTARAPQAGQYTPVAQ